MKCNRSLTKFKHLVGVPCEKWDLNRESHQREHENRWNEEEHENRIYYAEKHHKRPFSWGVDTNRSTQMEYEMDDIFSIIWFLFFSPLQISITFFAPKSMIIFDALIGKRIQRSEWACIFGLIMRFYEHGKACYVQMVKKEKFAGVDAISGSAHFRFASCIHLNRNNRREFFLFRSLLAMRARYVKRESFHFQLTLCKNSRTCKSSMYIYCVNEPRACKWVQQFGLMKEKQFVCQLNEEWSINQIAGTFCALCQCEEEKKNRERDKYGDRHLWPRRWHSKDTE